MSSLPTQDRRQHPRTPRIVRMILPWREERLKVFVTDASRGGLFVRTQVVPQVGSSVVLVFPEARAFDECVRFEGRVVRYVRRGDPHQPLGGVGVQLVRMLSPKGAAQARQTLRAVLGSLEADIPPSPGPVVVQLPEGRAGAISAPAVPRARTTAPEARPFEHTRPVTVGLAAFCRWGNMIIQAHLSRLGMEQAILTRLRVAPALGDTVTVRVLSLQEREFHGVEFVGRVDQVKADASRGSVVSLALDPTSRQPDPGGLLAFLRQLTDAPGPR